MWPTSVPKNHRHVGLLTGIDVWIKGRPYRELECFDPDCIIFRIEKRLAWLRAKQLEPNQNTSYHVYRQAAIAELEDILNNTNFNKLDDRT